MATALPQDEAFQTELLLRQTDERGETASPDAIPIDDETAGPNDLLADDETAGPEEDDTAGVEEQEDAQRDTADVKALAHYTNRGWFSPAQALTLMQRARQRGKKRGRKVERKRVRNRLQMRLPSSQVVPAAPPQPQPPVNLVPPDAGAKRLVDKWRRQSEPFIINQEGHYYYVAEVPFTCDGPTGTDDRAWLRIQKGTKIRFFESAIDDDMTYLGNPDKVTPEVTNYQRPSRNTYNDQDFLIKSITMAEAGLRVRYAPDVVSRLPALAAAQSVLNGTSWIWDDGGIFLPKEIFHDYSRENLLYRAIRSSSVLYFEWEKKRVGGNGTARSVLIDTAANIPDTSERRMSRTSGGAAVLPVQDGFIFNDNPEASEDGQFSAVLVIQHDVVFPVRSLPLAGPNTAPVRPQQVGLYLRLSLNGISFEKAKRSGVVMRA